MHFPLPSSARRNSFPLHLLDQGEMIRAFWARVKNGLRDLKLGVLAFLFLTRPPIVPQSYLLMCTLSRALRAYRVWF